MIQRLVLVHLKNVTSIFLKARKIMSDAGFELRKWETNLVELKEKIYDEIKENVSDVCVEKKV